MWAKVKQYFTKNNPVQDYISEQYGTDIGSQETPIFYTDAYNTLEVVRNGCDRITNACASFRINSMGKLRAPGFKPVATITEDRLLMLLNFKINPYIDRDRFMREIILDFLLDGNIFLYWDGFYFYHLPANNVNIITDKVTFVKSYNYAGLQEFKPNEIVHIADNSFDSIYRGTSRLRSASKSIQILKSMQEYQSNYFNNSAIPGIVLYSDNVLGEPAKQRLVKQWMQTYNPKSGGKKPIVIDGGMKLETLAKTAFSELDFENSIKDKEQAILQAIGVPRLLLDGGNNANIAPNLKLFYSETILPIVNMFVSAMEQFFGYDLEPTPPEGSALQPELRESAQYYSSLVNTGIITANEAREKLRWPRSDDPEADKLRVPANIAGSAADPAQGGRPPGTDNAKQ